MLVGLTADNAMSDLQQPLQEAGTVRPLPVDVTTETTIGQPLGVVAEYAADPDNATQWYANIRSVQWHGESGVRLGARVDFLAQFLGRRLAYTYEIVELIPEQRLVMRTADGPFPMETTYFWEADGQNATRMRLRNRGAPTGFSVLVAPILKMAMRRAMNQDLLRLKSILERS